MIKNSSISLNKLISIVVTDELGQPNWDDMLVPHGEFDLQLKLPPHGSPDSLLDCDSCAIESVTRATKILLGYADTNRSIGRTVAQCKDALRSLRSMASSTFNPVSQLPPTAATSNKRKSDQSFDQPVEQAQRRPSGPHQNLYNIQPRPSPTYSPRSQASFAQPPAAAPPKKRGRPSKAESERKHREAIERGEVIASISPRGGPGTSEGPSYQAIAPAPPDLSQAGGAVEPQPLRLASAESPDRRKRPKTAKVR